jgi:hypothetical protein
MATPLAVNTQPKLATTNSGLRLIVNFGMLFFGSLLVFLMRELCAVKRDVEAIAPPMSNFAYDHTTGILLYDVRIGPVSRMAFLKRPAVK